MYRLSGLVGALAAMLICAGCASPQGGERDVFPASEGTTSVNPSHTDEINDIGLQLLQNFTKSPIRLRSVTLVSPPSSLHMLNVRAYDVTQTKQYILGMLGVLTVECSDKFIPHPLDSFMIPAGRESPWFVVIAFTITKPGRYYLGKVRIDYTTDGHDGWQYQDIDTTMVIKNPPDPGPTPLPRSAVCDLADSRRGCPGAERGIS